MESERDVFCDDTEAKSWLISEVLDCRESVLFFSGMPSDLSVNVSLLSFFRFFRLRRSFDGGNFATHREPSRCRLSDSSSSDSRFRFLGVDCGSCVGLIAAAEVGWTDLGGSNSTVEVLDEGVNCHLGLLVADRMVLLDGV